MGIDYSSDLIKVSAVVPGKSFDIVLDESSKRSHPSLVVFDDDVRQYGTSASSLVRTQNDHLHSILTHHLALYFFKYLKYQFIAHHLIFYDSTSS